MCGPLVMVESSFSMTGELGADKRAAPRMTLECAVCAADPDNAWAVGTNGTVLHFDGAGWKRQASGTAVELTGVSATDSEHVWAVGWGATILSYNGSWKQQHSGTATLRGVFALDHNHVWAVGSGGTVLFYGGKGWARQKTSNNMELTSVCAVGPRHAWAVGLGGVVLVYRGAWRQDMNGPASLFGIAADETGRFLAVGYEVRAWSESPGTSIYSFDGHRWTEQQSIVTEYPTGVSTSAGRVWISGLGGIMYGEPK